MSYYHCILKNCYVVPPLFHCTLGYPEVLAAHLVLVIPLEVEKRRRVRLYKALLGLKDKNKQISYIYTAHSYSQAVLVFLETLEALAVPRKK